VEQTKEESAMLTERIVGALTFRRGVYAEVEADRMFTAAAWIIVVFFAFLNQLGSYASESFGFIPWAIIMSLTGVILTLLDITATGFGNLFGI
jgi:hypothetical protein